MNKILLVTDGKEAKKADGYTYYRDICNEERMRRVFAKGKDIAVTVHQFCRMIKRSWYRMSDYKDYLPKYELIVAGKIPTIENRKLSQDDIEALLRNFWDLNPNTGRLTWKKEHKDYEWWGKFGLEHYFAVNGELYYDGQKVYGVIPTESFLQFTKVTIRGNEELCKLFDKDKIPYEKEE